MALLVAPVRILSSAYTRLHANLGMPQPPIPENYTNDTNDTRNKCSRCLTTVLARLFSTFFKLALQTTLGRYQWPRSLDINHLCRAMA